ncbi:MAG: AsmA family protein, partial [Candidatus Aureabacteria bacterium]|nr:AsmA family protein [Candidatus Auribacterota bacterium]
PGLAITGGGACDLSVAGAGKAMKIDIALDLERSALAWGEGFKKPGGMAAALKVPLRRDGERVRWDGATLRLGGGTLASNGTLDVSGERVLKATLKSEQFPLESLKPLIGERTQLRGMGDVDCALDHNLSKPISEAVLKGTVRVTGGELFVPSLARPVSFDTVCTATPGNVRLGFNTVRLGSSVAEGYAAFELKEWPSFTCDINCPVINSDDFAAPSAAKKAAGKSAPGWIGSADAAVMQLGVRDSGYMKMLRGTGRITVGELKLGKLRARGGQARLSLAGGVLTVDDANLPLYDGQVGGKIVADLGGVDQRYALDAKISRVDMTKLLHDAYSYTDALSGTLSADVRATAEGRDAASVKKEICAKGRFSVEKGRLRSFGILQQMSPLFLLLGQQAKCRELASFGELLARAPKDTGLSKCEGGFLLQGDSWGTGDLLLELDDERNPMRLRLDGELRSGGAIRFIGHAAVPRGSGYYTQLEPYFPDEDGWIRLPFPIPIGGTLAQPSIDVEAARGSIVTCAAEVGKMRLRKEIEKKIDRTFEPKPLGPGAAKPGGALNAGDIGKELLKGASKELIKKVLQ